MKNATLFTVIFLLLVSCCKEDDEIYRTKIVNLQLDEYDTGASYNFVETRFLGEGVATTLGPVDNTFKIMSVKFLFGGTAEFRVTREVVLNIYKDNGTVIPGDLLYSANYTLVSSNTTIQEIDIRDKGIEVTGGGSIRVSFIMVDGTSFPTFAQEFDGTYFGTKNWVKELDGTWRSSKQGGLAGNWVIRATIEQRI
jgi:hypothetical protein